MEEAEEEVLAYLAFPPERWRRIYPPTRIESLIVELR
jgi:hypothetical protein